MAEYYVQVENALADYPTGQRNFQALPLRRRAAASVTVASTTSSPASDLFRNIVDRSARSACLSRWAVRMPDARPVGSVRTPTPVSSHARNATTLINSALMNPGILLPTMATDNATSSAIRSRYWTPPGHFAARSGKLA